MYKRGPPEEKKGKMRILVAREKASLLVSKRDKKTSLKKRGHGGSNWVQGKKEGSLSEKSPRRGETTI